MNWKLKILDFASESGYDFLTIVEIDSEDVETTLLDMHSGGMPGTVDYTSTESKVKFIWVSDASNVNLGFDVLIYEDDSGANTLNGPSDGQYSVSTGGVTGVAGKFVAEVDIVSSH